MSARLAIGALAVCGVAGCATVVEEGTLADLEQVAADTDEVYLEDSLERAADSYRRYLEETSESAMTPEAMRRLADLQIEREYGVMHGQIREMAAPETAAIEAPTAARSSGLDRAASGESDLDFENRATQLDELSTAPADAGLTGTGPLPTGPAEAIKTYQKLLDTYPDYERNDQVLYQMSRAYDEIGEPDEAMRVMQRLVAEYPFSRYIDEVHFRRGEYYFVRKKYLDAEDAYGAITAMGPSSSYYELALYKRGWTLYKQELYEEALHEYLAMLDHRHASGYDFENAEENEDDEVRVADTFRVISLSFSNLGDAGVVDEYFGENGHRPYADKIYSNLGEFYFDKLRYDDAASVYKSFVSLNPFHRKSPHFGMRVIEIYTEAGFPQLVVESKKEFAKSYALSAQYWRYVDVDESADVIGFLKTNLTDLANHYHALYQHDELPPEDRPETFREARDWYRQFLASFPQDPESPSVNYQLADLFLQNENFGEAAREYEHTAYNYAEHEQASAAGYAAIFAYREDLEVVAEARRTEVLQATVASSLRFSDAFPDHEQAPVVLGAAADDLYEMQDFGVAIASARKLIARYPDSDDTLLRSAWAVVANSSIDIAAYQDAEVAYQAVLGLTPEDDETRADIIDGLAASIYKQGEQAQDVEDYRTAAGHFLRIKDVAPTSTIRTSAEYDAAAALIKLADWTMAAGVLEEFRTSHPEHELTTEATKQLAVVYREDGQTERSASEFERIAAEATDPELSREALLTAGELYDEAESFDKAIGVYERYVAEYPRPLDIALETRTRMADLFRDRLDYVRYHEELRSIVDIDREAGGDRTDRSRYLAAQAALVLAKIDYERFAELELKQPFEESLAEKQQRMDVVLKALEGLVTYEVSEVTAAATFYIAETYFGFSAALLASERPAGLSDAEKMDYEMVIEEEAYPFEERSIEVHEANAGFLTSGIYNDWVQQSLDKLAVLMPGRYAKYEISAGFVGTVSYYAYRMPIAPPPDVIEGEDRPSRAASMETAQVVPAEDAQ